METKITDIPTEGYEKVIRFENPEVKLKGFIAVHNTKLGPGLGGIRFRPYKSEEQALRDVLRLSRAMTYKGAGAGLPLGGGKCVVFGDPYKDKSESLFLELGRVIDSLGGKYLGAENSGTNIKDMNIVRRTTPFVTGTSKEGDPSPVTALGVFQGIATYLEVLFNIRKLEGVRIAIQGVGNVGFHLGKSLAQAGAELIICDPHQNMIDRALKHYKATVVSPEDIFSQQVDVFSPCAYGGVLNPENIKKLSCKMVAGAANNQFEDEKRDPVLLHERGIWHAPDYVINAGGIIALYCEYKKETDKLTQRMVNIPKRLREILAKAQTDTLPPMQIADKIVESILKSN